MSPLARRARSVTSVVSADDEGRDDHAGHHRSGAGAAIIGSVEDRIAEAQAAAKRLRQEVNKRDAVPRPGRTPAADVGGREPFLPGGYHGLRHVPKARPEAGCGPDENFPGSSSLHRL